MSVRQRHDVREFGDLEGPPLALAHGSGCSQEAIIASLRDIVDRTPPPA